MNSISAKQASYEAFWRGQGPSLILISPAQQDLYDLNDYPARFYDPQAMWESEMRRAEPLVDWPTDGIPTVRPNLGVIFVPAMAGLHYKLPPNSMPWPGEPLPREAIRAAGDCDVSQTETMRLAQEFYAIHVASGRNDVVAYQADTQGVFDIVHLLYGDEVFYELADPNQSDWIAGLFNLALDLYCRATRHLKSLLAEPPTRMIHGHGTSQGVCFPTAGTRMAEDTATLLSATMVGKVIAATVENAAGPFGGTFVHFCGNRRDLFEVFARMEAVRAIDLGNPEAYDSRWVLEQCAATNTVLYSRLAAEPGEVWEAYTRRLAALVRQTGARVILRPMVFPENRAECAAMQSLWHEWTLP